MAFPIEPALRQALEAARKFRGATSPNPPVGAAALSSAGGILAVQAHQKAGTGHAEARLIQDLTQKGLLEKLHTLVVTLEPCNHTGRTPPCTEAILKTPARRVVYGTRDPNPRVEGHGAERLKAAGLEVDLPSDELQAECQALIAPFAHWVRTGMPYVTVKTALNREGTMIPPVGQKTFTSPESLKLAHELRKRSDAILTGSGTILADQPEFTVRHIADHPGKSRWLVVLDRRNRVPEAWVEAARGRGFRVRLEKDLREALKFLGSQGVLEVLVEAGPTLSEAVIAMGIWNEHVVIRQGESGRTQKEIHDQVYVHRNY